MSTLDADLDALCALHRSLGVPDEDHIVRSVVRRGRAVTEDMGLELEDGATLPELTLTADGTFLHPFAPTVRDGVTERISASPTGSVPLHEALAAFLSHEQTQLRGSDVVRNVR